MGVVAFDYTAWATRYPELAGSVGSPLATAYFNEATLYVDNTACSVIPYDPPTTTDRATILNMVTAHIAALNATVGGVAPSPLVGRIETAAEGSVNVTAKYADQTSGTMAWFVQTKYGAAAWQAMAPYRTATYVPGPAPQLNGLWSPYMGNPYGPYW